MGGIYCTRYHFVSQRISCAYNIIITIYLIECDISDTKSIFYIVKYMCVINL